MKVSLVQPTEAQIDRANDFSHAFIRFMIAEGIEPDMAMVYVAAVAAQVVMNVHEQGDGTLPLELAADMFRSNMLFFTELMGEKRTEYEYPNPKGL